MTIINIEQLNEALESLQEIYNWAEKEGLNNHDEELTIFKAAKLLADIWPDLEEMVEARNEDAPYEWYTSCQSGVCFNGKSLLLDGSYKDGQFIVTAANATQRIAKKMGE